MICGHMICGAAMNLTLSIDEKVAESARKAAQSMGKSLNQAVREYLDTSLATNRSRRNWLPTSDRRGRRLAV